MKRTRLDLSDIPEDLRDDFIQKRETYKKCNIERINRMKRSIEISAERKQSALNALPPRLAFISQISREPKWKSALPKSVQNVYFNLHHTAKTTPSTLSSLRTEEDKFYQITKMRHKEDSEIAQLEHDRMYTVKQYMFPTQPLPHFPPLYDPGDIRTQSAVVRSYFDYTFKPGMDVPIKEKKTSIDPDSHLTDDEKRQVYGHDYSGVQLAKLVNVESAGGSGIGGMEDVKKKLQQEEESQLTEKQKLQKERGKKSAEARAAESLRLEKIRQQKDKIKQSVKDWEKELKRSDKRKDEDANEGEDDDEESLRKENAMKRIEELEILNQDLPKMEALLVDKELNKKFFENDLPLMLNHELLDDDKRKECVMLVRKYHTLQTHVGYGVR